MTTQYATPSMTQRRLYDIIDFVSYKYHLKYEVIADHNTLFHAEFHDINIQQTITIQDKINNTSDAYG